jgi:ribosomal biogenesis protein LAS1
MCRKRTFPTDAFYPPKFSIELWSPLLADLHSLHPDFPMILSNKVISYLLADVPQPDLVLIAVDTTYDVCLARWAMWMIDTWDAENSESDLDLKKDAIVSLITGLGPGSSSDRDTTAYQHVLYSPSRS